MSETDVVDGTAIEETAIVPAAPPANLFRTDNPAIAAQRMTDVADALCPIIEQRKLYSDIQGRKYVKVEGWQTLGSMLGVTPVTVWTRRLEADEHQGWEARVEARTLDGRTIGAAEAECLRSENRWKIADDYAIRSMAQTRATSKALRSVLGFVVTLAGFEATPAEEVPADGFRDGGGGGGFKVTQKQIDKFILANKRKMSISDEDFARYLAQFGIDKVEDLPRSKADDLVKAMSNPISEPVDNPADADVPPDMDGLPEAGDPGADEPFAD